MNAAILLGSSWGAGTVEVVSGPQGEPGFPDTDPDPETPPDVDEEETAFFDLADTHSPVAVWVPDAAGDLIDREGGVGGAWIGTGSVQPQQPSLLLDDAAPWSVGLDGAVRSVIANRDDLDLAAFTVICVFQRRTLATYPWMTLVQRNDQADGANQPGAWGLSIADTGAPRWFVRDGSAAGIILEGAGASVPAGDISVMAGTSGPGGLELFLNGVSVATDAATLGSDLASQVVIGATRDGGSPFNGAIHVVMVIPSQLDATALAALSALVKDRVRWANDLTAFVQDGATMAFDPYPRALMASANPTIAVTVQPGNASAAVVSNEIAITGATEGADTAGRYTLTDGNGVTAPAVLRVTVTTATPYEPGSSRHLNAFSAASASHIPIGSSATFESASDPATSDMLGLTGIVIPNRDASSASYPFGGAFVIEAEAGDTQYTVTVAPGETAFGTIPVTLKIPEVVKTLTATTGDRTVMITAPDGVTQHNFYHFRWDGSKFVAGGCRVYQLDGLGHGVAADDRIGTSASGMAHFGTFYRPEWYHDKSIIVPNMIHIVLPRCSTYNKGLSKGLELPATTRDGGWQTINSGNIPYGAVFSFTHGFNLNSLGLSTDGLRTLGRPIDSYGLIAIDGRGCTSYAALRATSGSQSHQNLPASAAGVLQADMEKIRPHLRRITNGEWFNGQTVRGGGTARAPNRAVA